MMTATAPLGWLGIVRLGLVQTALGAIVVLTTSTLNRVMVVELALPAIAAGRAGRPALRRADVPAAAGLRLRCRRPAHALDRRRHGGAGARRRRLPPGHRIDGRPTRCSASRWPIVGFLLIGARRRRGRHVAAGAAGASASTSAGAPAAATIVWVMMIAGFVVTAALAGHLLDPFSPTRLVAGRERRCGRCLRRRRWSRCWNIEGECRGRRGAVEQPAGATRRFRAGARRGLARTASAALHDLRLRLDARLQRAGSDPRAVRRPRLRLSRRANRPSCRAAEWRRAGRHGAGGAGSAAGIGGRRFGSLQAWTIAGCVALGAGAVRPRAGAAWSARPGRCALSVFALGVANGVFAVAAIGSMMALVSDGARSREGVRMGLWGAAQAFAFGLGGFLGTLASDLARLARSAHRRSPMRASSLAEALCSVVAARPGAARLGDIADERRCTTR